MQRPEARTSAIVVVDVQEKLAAVMPEPALSALLRATSILLEAAEALSIPVVATEQYPKGLGPTLPPIAERLASVGAPVLPKLCFSACGDAAFEQALSGRSPRVVAVVGMEAHVCVFQTARDLASRGYEVHVPIDGVASRRDDHKQAGLSLCERAGATLTTAETLAFDWLGGAGTEAFKRLSRVIR